MRKIRSDQYLDTNFLEPEREYNIIFCVTYLTKYIQLKCQLFLLVPKIVQFQARRWPYFCSTQNFPAYTVSGKPKDIQMKWKKSTHRKTASHQTRNKHLFDSRGQTPDTICHFSGIFPKSRSCISISVVGTIFLGLCLESCRYHSWKGPRGTDRNCKQAAAIKFFLTVRIRCLAWFSIQQVVGKS